MKKQRFMEEQIIGVLKEVNIRPLGRFKSPCQLLFATYRISSLCDIHEIAQHFSSYTPCGRPIFVYNFRVSNDFHTYGSTGKQRSLARDSVKKRSGKSGWLSRSSRAFVTLLCAIERASI